MYSLEVTLQFWNGLGINLHITDLYDGPIARLILTVLPLTLGVSLTHLSINGPWAVRAPGGPAVPSAVERA